MENSKNRHIFGRCTPVRLSFCQPAYLNLALDKLLLGILNSIEGI